MIKKAIILGLAIITVFSCRQQEQKKSTYRYPFQDPSLDIEKRLDDLMPRMTLDEKILQMMSDAPAIDSLGIPAYNWWSEGAHGVARFGNVSVFPQPIAMAATFDEELVQQISSCLLYTSRCV